MHTSSQASNWIARWASLIRPGGRVLDVACGHGRHSHWLAQMGFEVTALDRDAQALAATQAQWPANTRPGQLVQADIENADWPLPHLQGQWDAVIVTNYLWRPLWPTLLAALAPNGVYLHETFAHGNASVGKPSRPDFLLAPGELLQVCSSLRVVAFEDGFATDPERFVQRIAAIHETPRALTQAAPTRHRLPA